MHGARAAVPRAPEAGGLSRVRPTAPGERCLPRGRGHALPRAPARVACAPAACARQLGAFLLLQVEPGRAEVSGRPCVGWVADLPVTLGAVAVLSNFRCRLRSSVGTGDTRRA